MPQYLEWPLRCSTIYDLPHPFTLSTIFGLVGCNPKAGRRAVLIGSWHHGHFGELNIYTVVSIFNVMLSLWGFCCSYDWFKAFCIVTILFCPINLGFNLMVGEEMWVLKLHQFRTAGITSVVPPQLSSAHQCCSAGT